MRKRHFSSNRNGQNSQGGYGGGNGQGGGQNRNRRHQRGHNNGMRRQHGHSGEGEFVSPRQVQAAKNNREKYINQARDAMASGDRVRAEYYYQHADHYQRILNLAEEQQAAQRQEQEAFDAADEELEGAEAFDDAGEDTGEDALSVSSDVQQGDVDAEEQPRAPRLQQRQPRRQPRQERGEEGDAPVQERAERQPRQHRAPRQERPRQPRDEQRHDDASNHGSQLEALLPAPKDI